MSKIIFRIYGVKVTLTMITLLECEDEFLQTMLRMLFQIDYYRHAHQDTLYSFALYAIKVLGDGEIVYRYTPPETDEFIVA